MSKCQETHYQQNKERILGYQRECYQQDKERILEYQKGYYQQNKKRINERNTKYQKHRYKTDAKFRLRDCITVGIYQSLKGSKDGQHWETLVGYTLKELKTHLEKLFQPGMTWDNYGVEGWEIDHIRPVSSFNFIKSEDREFKECWSLSNLQPLWRKDNRKKGSKVA